MATDSTDSCGKSMQPPTSVELTISLRVVQFFLIFGGMMSFLRILLQGTEAISDDAAPEDLEAARSIIDNLTRQLKLEDRLDEVEATWLKRLESQHSHWIDEYERLAKAIEKTPRT
uniref:HSCB_C domain-containing protein n=1 Tax=Ascaris lumbricoides TaxID=6252 RepID=A0A0M3IBL7_ASCLU